MKTFSEFDSASVTKGDNALSVDKRTWPRMYICNNLFLYSHRPDFLTRWEIHYARISWRKKLECWERIASSFVIMKDNRTKLRLIREKSSVRFPTLLLLNIKSIEFNRIVHFSLINFNQIDLIVQTYEYNILPIFIPSYTFSKAISSILSRLKYVKIRNTIASRNLFSCQNTKPCFTK